MTQKPGYIKGELPTKDQNNTQAIDQESADSRVPGYAAETERVSLKQPPEQASAVSSITATAPKAASTEAFFGGISKTVLSFAGLLLLMMLTNELLALWQNHWIAGSLGTLLLLLVVLGTLRVWRHERGALREVDQLKAEQETVQKALRAENLTDLKSALTPWLNRQAKVAPELITSFKATAQTRNTAEEYWQLYQLMVLRPLDQQADQLIQHYSLTTGTAVMVIPHAGLDGLVVLWRSRAMTRAIAQVYGLETTSLSAFRLFKQALITVMLVAGVETLAQEKLISEGSDELMNRILGGVSQSLLTARRTYKLGRLIQLACRPCGE
ncbi:protein of unknown function [Oceanospirillum multiglobuliferum]|uniref:DUF697 domain-containing protein n=1 Tax=Oceanospirillum multiglobuliferum TaxID=64969 RepID=A0A1T4PI20_9GAMM|nr:YcjF family protein [Oceanospirillum multiglobuliferum]OPX55538.1 hypothetical protein BTE48_07900 [Oceanospirillum multiglobuliferum]SJZ91149.1 protein of unknown function [Oceanospirillum multiglobuliferum]